MSGHPLGDVSVLALESGVSAPLCTRLLGDLGADVVKVERPGTGDVNRHWDTAVRGQSSAHVWVNRNKRSVELDLKSEDGREIARDLAERADVVVQNFSPGAVERLGLDYESLSAENEALIYLNVSGYGRDGPYRDRKAYDLVMQGETGLISLTGSPDQPAKIPLSVCDINAAMYGAIATLTALYRRETTGTGQEIEVTMFGGVLSWLGYFPLKYWHADEEPGRVGMRHHLLTPYGPYEAADGKYVNLAVLSEPHWEAFCQDVLEEPDLLEDSRFETNEARVDNRDVLEARLEELIVERPRDHWADRLAAAGIPWGDVNELADVLDHPQAHHLGMIEELETDDGPISVVDTPIELSDAELRRDPMPELGADTVAVLHSLGYSADEIERLRAADVI